MVDRKLKRSDRRKEIIVCECGVEIALVPNVKAMSDAIETHVAQHMQKAKESPTDIEAERIEDSLIAQVFRIAVESEDEKTKKKKSVKN